MNPDEVKKILKNALPDCEIQVEGDGRHFNLVLVGVVFEGLRKVKRQLIVNAALSDLFEDGAIHAIDNMSTFTPEEWAAR